MSRGSRIFIDESGSPDFSSRDKHEFLIISAVTFPDKKDYREFSREIAYLKQKWFGYLGERLSIHAYEVFNAPKFSPWRILGPERVRFFEEYTYIVWTFAREKAFRVSGIGINKEKIFSKAQKKDWYAIAVFMALERLDGLLEDRGKVKVFAESRNRTDDDRLFEKYRQIVSGEFKFGRGSSRVLKARYYPKLIFRKKGSESGLDLADTFAYLYNRDLKNLGPDKVRNDIKKALLELLTDKWAEIERYVRVKKFKLWPEK